MIVTLFVLLYNILRLHFSSVFYFRILNISLVSPNLSIMNGKWVFGPQVAKNKAGKKKDESDQKFLELKEKAKRARQLKRGKTYSTKWY